MAERKHTDFSKFEAQMSDLEGMQTAEQRKLTDLVLQKEQLRWQLAEVDSRIATLKASNSRKAKALTSIELKYQQAIADQIEQFNIDMARLSQSQEPIVRDVGNIMASILADKLALEHMPYIVDKLKRVFVINTTGSSEKPTCDIELAVQNDSYLVGFSTQLSTVLEKDVQSVIQRQTVSAEVPEGFEVNPWIFGFQIDMSQEQPSAKAILFASKTNIIKNENIMVPFVLDRDPASSIILDLVHSTLSSGDIILDYLPGRKGFHTVPRAYRKE
ncbi:hypothetical protein HYT02_04120 [Candidatus Gottesmanbacteria bacterium]|nr:hypothetical protein [Candidatus Gottesmanbacteria bacterium]